MFDWLLKQKAQGKTPQQKFYIQTQPRIIQTNSNIMVTCYTSRTRQGIVPCRFCWYRTKNGVTSVIPHVKGSTYMCEPSDLGAIIRVEVTSLDEEASGSATLQFGPVKIDLLTRKNVEAVLSAGFGNFTVFLGGPKENERECVLKISDGTARITDVQSQSSYKFEYTIAEPRLDINPRDHTKLTIHFTERYQQQLLKFLQPLFPQYPNQPNLLLLRFPTRPSLDTLLYCHKAFTSKKQSKTSHLLNKIQNTDQSNEQTFNFSMQISSLKTDMVRLLEVNRAQARDKQFYADEVKRLEEELETIIMTYTKIIEDRCRDQQDFDKSYVVLAEKREEVVMKRQAQLEIENKELRRRGKVLEEENLQLRARAGRVQPVGGFTKKAAPYEDIDCKMEELSVMNSRLVDQNKKLKVNQQHNSQDMHNILANLNESAMHPDPNIERLTQLQKEKDELSRKLQSALLKNQQLERSFKHPQAMSVKLQAHRRNPTPRQSLLLQHHPDSKRLISQLSQLRRDNQLLLHQNRQLRSINRSNNDLSKLSSPLTVSPVREQQSVGGQPRGGPSASDLKREIEELTSVNTMLERKCDGLVVENSELRRKVAFLEGQVEEAEMRLQGGGEVMKEGHPLLKERDQRVRELEAERHMLREQLLNVSRLDTLKYKKKIEELMEENKMLRKGTDVMNKSRDLSIEMDAYYQQQNEAIKKQNALLIEQNQKLIKLQDRNLKDAKQANKLRSQVIQLRKDIDQLRRSRQPLP